MSKIIKGGRCSILRLSTLSKSVRPLAYTCDINADSGRTQEVLMCILCVSRCNNRASAGSAQMQKRLNWYLESVPFKPIA